MTRRGTAIVLALCIAGFAASVEAAGADDVSSPMEEVCEAAAASSAPNTPRQEFAAARAGTIAGLGSVSAAIGWDGRKGFSLAGEDFTVTRSFTPSTREVEISIAGKGERPLVIRLGGGGLQVSKGGRAVDVRSADDLRRALRGRAVSSFRERIGNYERRLIAGKAARLDDPHADAFLFVGAFVASLDGDPTAVGRARDLVLQRVRAKLRAVRFDFRDCVTEYERYLLKIDKQRTECLDAANDRESWYARAADRLGCEAEFIAQALSGEGQFISCTALGSVLL
jgi:hypothetical protein